MIIRLASTSKWSSFRASVYQVLSIYVIMVVFMLLILIMIKLHCCNWGWWQYFPQTTARLYSQTQVAQQQFLWSPGEAVWEGGEWLRLIVPALRWRSFFLKNRTSVILQMQIYLLMRSFGFWQYNLISGTQMTSICTTTWQGIFSQNIISSKLTSDISSLAWKGLSLERRLGSPKFFLTITILTIASRSKFVNKSFHCFIKESAMSSIFWLPACSTSCWLSWVQSCWRTIPSWDSVP